MTCGCRIDWVLCLNADCPRAARIRAMQEAAWEQGRKLIGDPMVGVGVTMGASGPLLLETKIIYQSTEWMETFPDGDPE